MDTLRTVYPFPHLRLFICIFLSLSSSRVAKIVVVESDSA